MQVYATNFIFRNRASFLKPFFSVVVGVVFTNSLDAQSYLSGVGEYSCQRFLENVVHTDIQIAALSWAQGFVAGINIAAINDQGFYYDVTGMTGNDVLKHLVTFCRFNLAANVIDASDALLATLPKVQAN